MVKLLFIFLVSITLHAKSGQIVAGGGSPIPQLYDASDSQTQGVTCNSSKRVMIHNETSDRLAWGVGTLTEAPSTDEGFVIANFTVARDGMNVSSNNVIYIRSDSGSDITSGTVSVECW